MSSLAVKIQSRAHFQGAYRKEKVRLEGNIRNFVPSNNSIECKSQILWTYANEELLYYFDFLKIGTELLAVASSDNFQLAFHLPEWQMQDGHILRDS